MALRITIKMVVDDEQGVREESAKHNTFMFSVIESCKMNKRSVEGYMESLLDRLKISRGVDDLTDLLPCNLAT